MNGAVKFNLLRITEFKGFIAMTILFAFLGVASLYGGMTLYLIVTPIMGGGIVSNSLITDERYHMNSYVNAMPFSHRNMVSAEYLVSAILMAISIALMLFLTVCMMTIFRWTASSDVIDCGLKNNLEVIHMILFFTSGMAMLILSIALTGFYYGMNKGLTVFIASIVLGVGIVIAYIVSGVGLGVNLIIFAVGIVAFALSWYTSVKRNEKRDI